MRIYIRVDAITGQVRARVRNMHLRHTRSVLLAILVLMTAAVVPVTAGERAFTLSTARKMMDRLYDAAYANVERMANDTNASAPVTGRQFVASVARSMMRTAEYPPFETTDRNFVLLANMVRSLTRVVASQQLTIHKLAVAQGMEGVPSVCKDRKFMGDPNHDAAREILGVKLRQIEDPTVVRARRDLGGSQGAADTGAGSY